jgi:tetratricopeptide (TPR) repeat protein
VKSGIKRNNFSLKRGVVMRISRKARIVPALLLGVPFFFGGCASPLKPQLSATAQAEALSHFSLGLLAEAGDDSEAALSHFEAAIRLDPGEEKVYAPAVAIALKLKQPDTAIKLAQKLAKRYPDSTESQLLLARVYALTDQTDPAEILFRKVQKKSPEHPDAPLFLAQLYLSQDKPAEALETLREAMKVQSKNADLLYLTGTLCIDRARGMGDTHEARTAVQEGIAFLQQALEIDPQNPLRWQQTGLALLAIDQLDEALQAFQEARLYAPSDVLLARQTFTLLIQAGKYDDALNMYDELAAETGTEPELWLQYLAEKMPEEEHVKLTGYLEKQLSEQPQAPVFYYAQLGSLYIGAHKNQEADAVLLKALENYPADNRLKILLGYLYLQQDRNEDAYAALERVRTESPEAEWSANPFFLFNFLMSAQKSGRPEQAAQVLASIYTNSTDVLSQYISSLLTGRSPASIESTIELLTVFYTLRPEASEALYYLMVLQAEQKEYLKAIETAKQFEILALKNGDTNLLNGQFYYQHAALYERTGQLETAEKLFLTVIETGEEPLASSAKNYVAYMWAERGEKLDAGLKLVQEALSADPENGAFLDTLGWIYYMQGRYAEALKELQKARLVAEDDPTVWEHLGDTYLKLGNLNEASRHWKKALDFDPESQRLIDRLKVRGITSDGLPEPTDNPADTTLRP